MELPHLKLKTLRQRGLPTTLSKDGITSQALLMDDESLRGKSKLTGYLIFVSDEDVEILNNKTA